MCLILLLLLLLLLLRGVLAATYLDSEGAGFLVEVRHGESNAAVELAAVAGVAT